MTCTCTLSTRGFRQVGYGWTLGDDGSTWNRYLLRRCLGCHMVSIDRVTFIKQNLPICTWCLSQEVGHIDVNGEPHEKCFGCGRTSILVEETV